jgi:hypothetical protein
MIRDLGWKNPDPGSGIRDGKIQILDIPDTQYKVCIYI